MATLKTSSTTFNSSIDRTTLDLSNSWVRYISFADSQKSHHLLWWLISLLIHCIFVPLTFLLSYALNGPTISILGISMVLFFINVVGNMSGASTRFTILAFFASMLIHLILIAIILV